jgi:hypothetical protein
MSYNSKNYNKWAANVVEVYRALKNADMPDTEIIRREFPKHNIFISYRQWMNIKGRPIPKAQPTRQLELF